ncbi:MAG TPA: hypothetical protein VIL74_12415 [Pyrinomonadaceae bacterium]|jgi:hypothetical protein
MRLQYLFQFAFILFFASFVFAQGSLKTTGNIIIEVKKGKIDFVKSADLAYVPKTTDLVFFDIPLKEKIPMLIGGTQKLFFCYHCTNYEISTSIFKKTEDEAAVRISIKSDKAEYFQKVIKLRKGETKSGKMKHGLSFWIRFDEFTK